MSTDDPLLRAPRSPGLSVRSALLATFLTLLGLVGVGRLAIAAWLERPVPSGLPKVGGTASEASPLLLVVLDGVRESAVFGEDAPMASLRALGEDGVSGIALAGDPTLTATCVRSILTGRAPDLVTAFRNFDARPVEGSVVEYLAGLGARAAHGGDAAVHQLCRTSYAPEDVLSFPDQGPMDQGQCDERAVPFVLRKIDEGCDLVTLHLTRPDHAAHRWGAVGPEYREACRIVDGQVARVVAHFRSKHAEATVLVAADHGVTPAGTHGGGEMAARRAPFVLVGPRVARRSNVEVSQCALAPTLSALLGLPQPPLADAPPDVDLIERTAMEEARAVDAYVQARAAVARSLGEGGVDPIERRRAAASVRRLAPGQAQEMLAVAAEVNGLLLPSRRGYGLLALVVAALWLATLVHVSSSRSATDGASLVAAAFVLLTFALAFDPISSTLAVGATEAGALTVVACGLALGATRGLTLRGAAVAVAALAALPLLAAASGTIQAGLDAEGSAAPAWRAAGVALALLAVLAAFLRPGSVRDRVRVLVARAPGVLPAAAGAALGLLLSVRVFVDPLLDVRHVVAACGVGTAAWMVFGRAGRTRPSSERLLLGVVAALLFVGTRLADALLVPDGQPGSWIGAAAGREWLAIGVAMLLVLAAVLPVRRLRKADALGVGLSVGALALAHAFRILTLGPSAPSGPLLEILARGALALGVGAFLWAWRFGTPEGRLAVRTLATVAIARRLLVSDAEFATFALLAVGTALAARWPAPRTRLGLAGLAVGLLLVRTAAFHAMGKTESFSTFDVAGGFLGLGNAGPDVSEGAASARLLEAGLQVAFLHALPWLLLLSAASRALSDAGGLRRLVADLAVGFAARGAALVFALWAWWRSAWWTGHAYPVYALGAGDVVLLVAAALLAGAFTDRRAAAAFAKARYFPQEDPAPPHEAPPPPPGAGAGASPGLGEPAGLSAGLASSSL